MELILLKTVVEFYFSSIVVQFSFIHGAEVRGALPSPLLAPSENIYRKGVLRLWVQKIIVS